MPRNIAVVGPLRSGKDSVAAMLQGDYGYRKLAFADALKGEVMAALNAVDGGGWTMQRIEAEKVALRPVLQAWGVMRRTQNPRYWLEQVERDIQTNGTAPLVVTDGRFANELDMLRKYQFTIIKLAMPEYLLRPHLKGIAGMTDEQIDEALAHVSEREWQEFPPDYVVSSYPGKLDDLLAKVKGLV